MKKTKNFLDHSIFIPTKNRPSWIEYSLMHYDYFNYGGTIVIVDDSSEDLFLNTSKIIKKFSNKLNIRHIKGNGKKPRHISCCEARSSGLRNIDSSYYSTTSDDDILYTPNLNLFIDFMNKNNSYASVVGNHIIYDLNNNYNIEKKKIYMGQECHYEDPVDRLTCYANESGIATYGVVRTESHKPLWDLERKRKSAFFTRKCSHGIEYFDEEIPWVAQIYVAGKIATLNYPQYFRLKSNLVDRIELAYKRKNLDNYVLGNIGLILNNTLSKSCNETFNEFKELINYQKSKYDNDIVEYQVKQFIWSFLKGYDGAGLNRGSIDYSADYLKVKNKKKYIRININLFSFNAIKIIYRKILFLKNSYFITKEFKKNHIKFKQVFFNE
jgi:glycosyltransferase domain-containing protein